MAGDWIKVRTNLARDGRVARIVDLTRSRTAVVLGALVMLWSIADEITSDGVLIGYSFERINRIVELKGFAEAMAHPDVRWLEKIDNGVRIPDFTRHNGESAKARHQNAARVAKHRSKKAKGDAPVTEPSPSCSAPSVTDSLHERDLEKRREEKSNESSSTPAGVNASGYEADRLYADTARAIATAMGLPELRPGEQMQVHRALEKWRTLGPASIRGAPVDADAMIRAAVDQLMAAGKRGGPATGFLRWISTVLDSSYRDGVMPGERLDDRPIQQTHDGTTTAGVRRGGREADANARRAARASDEYN